MRKTVLSFFLCSSFILLSRSSSAQNIALAKTAVASSIENSNFPASLVNDGHGDGTEVDGSGGCSGTCTRWASQPSDPQWIYIDLASIYTLTEVRLNWEVASGRDFSVQVSNDANTWTTVQTITNNNSYINIINMTGYSGRYVRMYATARNTTFGYSLWEFEIYGSIVTPLGSNIALGAPAVASSEQNPAVVASAAVDGEGDADDVDYLGGCTGLCTFWASDEGVDPQWIYVDLGQKYNLRQTIIHWGFFNASNFQIEVSDDAVTWTPVASLTGNTAYSNTLDLTGAAGRYVRLLGTARNTIYSYTVYEFEVYGTLTSLPVHLTDFSARATTAGDAIVLEWRTGVETNNKHFEVEHSTDGNSWKRVGVVSAKGSGSTYQYEHATSALKNYYRLKQVDIDNKSTYSRIRTVNLTQTKEKVSIYPNPVLGTSITIDLGTIPAKVVSYTLINSSGYILKKGQLKSRVEEIQVPSLTPGIYLLQLSNGHTLKVQKD